MNVLLLHVHYYPELCFCTMLHTSRRANVRDINISSTFETIRGKHAAAILEFHVMAGCDQMKKFKRKLK